MREIAELQNGRGERRRGARLGQETATGLASSLGQGLGGALSWSPRLVRRRGHGSAIFLGNAPQGRRFLRLADADRAGFRRPSATAAAA